MVLLKWEHLVEWVLSLLLLARKDPALATAWEQLNQVCHSQSQVELAHHLTSIYFHQIEDH